MCIRYGYFVVWRLREGDNAHPRSRRAPQPPRRRAYLLTLSLRAPRSPRCSVGPELRRLASQEAKLIKQGRHRLTLKVKQLSVKLI